MDQDTHKLARARNRTNDVDQEAAGASQEEENMSCKGVRLARPTSRRHMLDSCRPEAGMKYSYCCQHHSHWLDIAPCLAFSADCVAFLSSNLVPVDCTAFPPILSTFDEVVLCCSTL